MQPFTSHTGRVAALDRADVDTDQIIPKQFLKRIERTGYDTFLFFDWRYLADGAPNPEFELNQPAMQNSTVLLARRNFGCGSSREHAVWALENYGFRAVLAPSFADIFYNNCFKNGVLPVKMSEEDIEDLFQQQSRAGAAGFQLTVDLNARQVSAGDAWRRDFEVDEFRRHCMLNGLDDIALTLQHEAKITSYEERQSAALRP